MKKYFCTYVTTNSANATLVASTDKCLFIGAHIGGGVGTLTIKAGATTFLGLKSTANLDSVGYAPAIPVALMAGLNATCSGTGICTLFYAKA